MGDGACIPPLGVSMYLACHEETVQQQQQQHHSGRGLVTLLRHEVVLGTLS